jgi:hypothetical protein
MRIETKDYSYQCGDGCCYEYGTILYIDGKQITDRRFSCEAEAYLYILQDVLGHQVDYIDDEEEAPQ